MLRVIVPFHNAAAWLARCTESIACQTVLDWRCDFVDDFSDDGSTDLALGETQTDVRFQVTRNAVRRYRSESIRGVLANPSFAAQDICLAIDGDDYLPDSRVFERVLDAYADGMTWLTWGSQIRTDGLPDFNGPVDDTSQIRKVSWRTSHLQTWKLFLWRSIKPEDFCGPDGMPVRVAGDLATMYPMIEMAGNRHVKYLRSVNYVYNRDNPLSNFRVRPDEQRRNGEFFRSKPPYVPLPDSAAE